jgi:3-hydroxymyristoyl/3-hydroxydecanoyl-(acyl carrier protein) dehydratase
MQDPTRTATNPPEGTPVHAMPRAPSVLADAPLPPRTGAAPTHVHPMEAQHERIAAMHAQFLRTQEQVHTDFLAHRQRLIESLGHALAHSPAPGSEDALDASEVAPTPEVPVVASARAIGWSDWFLDSHVAPAGLFLGPLGALAARGGVFLDCTLEHLARLPGPGDTLVCELRKSGEGGDAAFRVDGYVNDPSRPAVRIVGRAYPDDGSAASALPASGSAAPAPKGVVWTEKRQFTENDLLALTDGALLTCFGKGFERTASHTRTTPLPGLALARLTSVGAFDPTGGPWSAGFVRARVVSTPEEAPPAGEDGLEIARVYQGALQTLGFFLMAAGRTIDRDGWRLEPTQGAAHARFFGSVPYDVPLDYEVAIERFDDGPAAGVVGYVTARANGHVVFQSDDLGLRLVPDFPLTSDLELQAEGEAEARLERPTTEVEGFRIGYKSLLAGALGWPSQAFREPGGFFETGERTMPRLPGPPYHFITRVTALAGERLTMKPGAEATMDYDVPPDAWYFDESGTKSMPFCVLLEAALQPCGWLSVYVGCPLATSEDVFFRNLDGSGMVIVDEVFPDSGTLTTHAKVISVTQVSGVIILSYRIRCTVGEKLICKLDATFGYFPKEALATQAGLPMPDTLKARLTAESSVRVDLSERQEKYFADALRLPGPALLMMDRVTGYWPDGGAAGKGLLRAEKDVKPSEWFFKAHFFSDPVQPGSLGLEMMLQLLQYFLIEKDLGKGIDAPYFEPFVLNSTVSWKFRGQVRPSARHVVTDVEIVSLDVQPDQVTVIANGSLWVDGIRCYEAKGMGVRIKGHRPSVARPPMVVDAVVETDGADRWVTDHRPSHTVPVMPMTSMVDRLAGASLAFVRAAYPPIGQGPAWVVLGGDELRAHGWLVCDERKHLRTSVKLLRGRASTRLEEVETSTTLYELNDGAEPRRVASGRVRLGRRYPNPPRAWSPLADGKPSPTPYESGAIGHGPALQLIRRIAYGSRGASAELDAAGGSAPVGTLHQALLDGALQAIPHDELDRWSDKIAPNHVGVPVRTTARFFGPPPVEGTVRLELRFVGFDGGAALPTFGIQLIAPDGRVWAALRHVELLVPTGPQTQFRAQRVPFLVEKKYVEGACLSRFFEDRSELADADVKRMDWIPGSVAYVYGLVRGAPIDDRVLAVKDYVSNQLKVHPAHVAVSAITGGAGETARAEGSYDGRTFPVTIELRGSDVIVKGAR